MMMRDYKFRETEWPRRRARGKTLRALAAVVAVVALALLGVVVWHLLQQPAETAAQPTAAATAPNDPRVIPLQIPPQQEALAPSGAQGSNPSPDSD
jgi:cytoskeletal protein RodZ